MGSTVAVPGASLGRLLMKRGCRARARRCARCRILRALQQLRTFHSKGTSSCKLSCILIVGVFIKKVWTTKDRSMEGFGLRLCLVAFQDISVVLLLLWSRREFLVWTTDFIFGCSGGTNHTVSLNSWWGPCSQGYITNTSSLEGSL